jgi:hypothetical protein
MGFLGLLAVPDNEKLRDDSLPLGDQVEIESPWSLHKESFWELHFIGHSSRLEVNYWIIEDR